MNTIVLAVIIVAAIGLIAGIGLSLAAIFFATPVDEKFEKVREALPGANCGACGYSGCDGYAKALCDGSAVNGLCSPGGADSAKVIGEILGSGAVEMVRKTAVVRCIGTLDNTTDKMEYEGIKSCAAAMQHFGGVSGCSYGCMGIGDCVNECDYNAISICNGAAHIDYDLCKACGKCVKACPKNLIELVPYSQKKMVRCRNADKGGVTRKVCTAGCIGCMKCQKNCEAGAITVANSLASIDLSKCTNCGKCAEVCPSKCITDLICKSGTPTDKFTHMI